MNAGGRTFDAWSLPRGIPLPPGPGATFRSGDVRVRFLEVDAAWVRSVADGLRSARAALRARSARDIAAVLGTAGGRFLDLGDPLRERALGALPGTSGLSAEMAAAVLDGMASDWTAERLARLLEAELGDPAALDGFVPGTAGRITAVGPDLCTQIVSGSVPGVGATALIRSLLVKGPTLLKPGRGDVVLPVLMAEAIRSADADLGDAVAVAYWPGGTEAAEDAAMSSADVVTVYGADETVAALRARAPIGTRLVGYPNRIGFGVVGREALEPARRHRVVSEVAGAVAFFDQRGCVSPQVVYVEGGGDVSPADVARELAAAMEALERHLPGGTLDPREASQVHQVRGAAEVVAAAGSGVEVHHGGSASWTVIYDPLPAFAPSCPGRVVRVKPVGDVLDVPRLVAPFGRHLQSVGVAGCGSRLEALASDLAGVGVSRVAGFDAIPFPAPWWHHDGQGPLGVLLRWMDLEI